MDDYSQTSEVHGFRYVENLARRCPTGDTTERHQPWQHVHSNRDTGCTPSARDGPAAHCRLLREVLPAVYSERRCQQALAAVPCSGASRGTTGAPPLLVLLLLEQHNDDCPSARKTSHTRGAVCLPILPASPAPEFLHLRCLPKEGAHHGQAVSLRPLFRTVLLEKQLGCTPKSAHSRETVWLPVLSAVLVQEARPRHSRAKAFVRPCSARL